MVLWGSAVPQPPLGAESSHRACRPGGITSLCDLSWCHLLGSAPGPALHSVKREGAEAADGAQQVTQLRGWQYQPPETSVTSRASFLKSMLRKHHIATTGTSRAIPVQQAF